MTYIFISHAHEDSKAAETLAQRFALAGYDYWLAVPPLDGAAAHNDTGGDDNVDDQWVSVVEALEGCAAFVSIVSPAAKRSEWVQNEILVATDIGKPAFALFLRDGDLLDANNVSVFVRESDFISELTAEAVAQPGSGINFAWG